MRISLVFAILSSFTFSACTSTYRVDGGPGALAKRTTARVVVSADDSGDASCRRAIERELRARGFQTGESGKESLAVKMVDTWRWDIVMYLMELDLVFSDSESGAMKAQAHYRNSAFHGYPSQSQVVEELFRQLDAKGVFAK